MLQKLSNHISRSFRQLVSVTVLMSVGECLLYEHRQQPNVYYGLRCAQQQDVEIGNVVRNCRPFLVSIFLPTLSDQMLIRGYASGFIVDNQLGLIVTNNHVAQAHDRLRLILFNTTRRYCDVFVGADQNQAIAQEISGRVVYTSPDHDLALIQLPTVRPNVLPVCTFTADDDCQPGDPIIALSSARGRCMVAEGLVIKQDKRQNLINCNEFAEFTNLIGDTTDLLVHSGFIGSGYSGGPVVNMSGQIVGVHMASMHCSSHFGLAIGAKNVMDFIEEGKQYLLTENVKFIQGLDKKHRQFIKRKTLGIVLEGNHIVGITFAAQTIRQLLRVTDKIVSYDNIICTIPETLSDYVQQLPDNIEISLTIYRSNGQIFSIKCQPINCEQFKC
ncbi:uncharacterized serine protease syc0938_d-like [Oppia nitens]|uniref:uncharacterized serine protease syc0938_d-like n=1 Tax=Oppia nitens TaxID=1686743 RepID=UPI0023D9B8AB|nr:uncharacterized serine protease syc0938_d-like [Oppia nitens]